MRMSSTMNVFKTNNNLSDFQYHITSYLMQYQLRMALTVVQSNIVLAKVNVPKGNFSHVDLFGGSLRIRLNLNSLSFTCVDSDTKSNPCREEQQFEFRIISDLIQFIFSYIYMRNMR